VEDQARRHSERGGEESSSAARLAAVWAEQDAEIEARIGGTAAMSYRFKCRHCGSQFSLEQQKDDHEAECAKAGAGSRAKATASNGHQRICKYCGELQPTFADYGRHRWAVHREEVLAELATKREQGKADKKKIDGAIAGKKADKAPRASPQRGRTSPPLTQPNAGTCPTCGGVIPASTAQLVHELTVAGISEVLAFEAARIARRVLGAGAAA
jgi:hypothetical protein